MADTPSSTTALVLCGGLGTRLRPVTGALPKGLAPVEGRPFLDYMFRYLHGQGVRDVVLCTGYAADQVEAACGDGSPWGLQVRYSREAQPLGTGGAAKLAEPLIASDPFFLLNGDSLVHADLGRLARFHRDKRAKISMVLVHVADKSPFGAVRRGEGDSVAGFSEKGQGGPGWINGGIYLIDRSVLADLPAGEPVSIEKEVFPRYAANGLYGMEAAGSFIDIGTPESYARAASVLAGGPEGGCG
jgi:NDP-sugar pyrophosphorylase family protein